MKSIEQDNKLISVKHKERSVNVPFKFSPEFEQPFLKVFHMFGR